MTYIDAQVVALVDVRWVPNLPRQLAMHSHAACISRQRAEYSILNQYQVHLYMFAAHSADGTVNRYGNKFESWIFSKQTLRGLLPRWLEL